jgi:hypothetical protein
MDEFPNWQQELPAFPHKMFDTPLKAVVEYYLEHIQRDTQDGKLGPANYWILLRGLLLGAFQSYAAVCLLLSGKRAKPFMLQAGILNRSTFETLTNVCALVQDPKRAGVLEREAFKSLASRHVTFQAQYGADPKWTEYLGVFKKSIELIAKHLGLTDAEIADPAKVDANWPTPGILIYGHAGRKIEPWVTGSARDVLKSLYDLNYPHQSELTHQRLAAVSSAMLVDNPEMQWNPGHGESHLVLTAILLVACIVSELQAVGGYARHPRLAELWGYMREMDEDVKVLWATRYESLVAPTEQPER